MASELMLTDGEMVVDQGLGHPKAYAKLCWDRNFWPLSNGPPFNFIPYELGLQEDSRAKELDDMFPIIDHKAKPSTNPKIFVSLLWKQLNHLGNAGFDPEIFRIDPYGNVLYYHADPASPLAWEIDHWFPCSRGGLTVPRNLRILQWQVCKGKHNKLEFLMPWWEFQVGISVNQFLSIFASSRSDFRHRAFSWLFLEGESEEINSSQTVDSHTFPHPFIESKEKIGLAPAAVVVSRRGSSDGPLRFLDVNTRPRSSSPMIVKKIKQFTPKENENPNTYQAIVLARDSLKQREMTINMQAEMHKLDNEANELQQKSEEEKVSIQDLELMLIKKKRRVEKCRRLAESQSSYRAMLEKMIRDAMHQSVVYKEQVRLNHAASSALMARLEAQRAICDSAERELHRKYEQRDELEKQIRPELEQVRKRSRMQEENDTNITQYLTRNKQKMVQETELLSDKPKVVQATEQVSDSQWARNIKNALCLTESKSAVATLRKELRKFLEEEQKASAASSFLGEEQQNEEFDGQKEISNNIRILKSSIDKGKAIDVDEDNNGLTEERLEMIEVSEDLGNINFPDYDVPEAHEDEESRKLRGKGNIEKWLQFLLENSTIEDADSDPPNIDESETTRINTWVIGQKAVGDGIANEPMEMDARNSNLSSQEKDTLVRNEKEVFDMKNPPYRIDQEIVQAKELASIDKGEVENDEGGEQKLKKGKSGKGSALPRSDSKRAFRRIPSSPSLIFEGMKKRVDCIGKKPLVLDDDTVDNSSARNSFITSSIKTIKKSMRF